MPGSADESPEMMEEEMAHSVLNQFIGISEQTYEDFLSTFTWLPQERNIGGLQSEPSLKYGSSIENIPAGQGSEDLPDTGDLEDPEQLVLGEGDIVGCCHSLTYPRRVQVDNFLASSDADTDSDNEAMRPNIVLYPGEAEPELPHEAKPIVRSTCLDMRGFSDPQATTHEHLCDQIQPFSLDQNFDYDRVALTPKLASAELDFLNVRKPQQGEDVITDELTRRLHH